MLIFPGVIEWSVVKQGKKQLIEESFIDLQIFNCFKIHSMSIAAIKVNTRPIIEFMKPPPWTSMNTGSSLTPSDRYWKDLPYSSIVFVECAGNAHI